MIAKIIVVSGLICATVSLASSAEKVIHVIPHSHWDREWYMPFEQHRIRLVKLLDDVLEEISQNDRFFFLMDGHTVPFDDYLQIRPRNRSLLQQAILSRKISYGPQYILQDAFLTDAESHVRNHLIALLDAELWMPDKKALRKDDIIVPDFFMTVGYFPDTFGNISQSPQILRGFGIETAMVGRGFAPEKTGSEFWWQSPDGSRVFTHNFSDWYCNGRELPDDPSEVWPRLHNSLKWATSNHLLLMNGCDHQPLQKNILDVIAALNAKLKNTSIRLSTPQEFLQAVQQSGGSWKTFYGEARYQQRKSGLGLEDVQSSRLYLKQANFHSLSRMERYAEPLAAFASKYADYTYPHDLLNYAWKLLLQNQVHDDICGCSVDAVHKDMMCRFRHVDEVTDAVIASAFKALVKAIDLSAAGSDQVALVVFNPTNAERNDVIIAHVDFPDETEIQNIKVQDARGRTVPARLIKTERIFAYDLPDDRFRVPYHQIRATIEMPASVAPLGYNSYFVTPVQQSPPLRLADRVAVSEKSLQNQYIKVSIKNNGLIDLTDKTSGKTYRDLCLFQLRSDHGDEYNFRAVKGEQPKRLDSPVDDVKIIANSGLSGTVRITRKVTWGKELDDENRRVGNGSLVLQTDLTLKANSRMLEVSVVMDNHLKDYRLRAQFPTGLKSKWIYSEGDFSIDKRAVRPIKGYERDSYTIPQHNFSFITDGQSSFILANKGLTEIEPVVEKDGTVTLGLTLLRCVGELGDWGYFPTKDSQCQGRQVAEFAILPTAGNCLQTQDYAQVYSYTLPLYSLSSAGHTGALPAEQKLLEMNIPKFVLTAIKMAEKRSGIIVRGYNPSDRSLSGTIAGLGVRSAHITDLKEHRLRSLQGDNSFPVSIDPYKIVTFELQ